MGLEYSGFIKARVKRTGEALTTKWSLAKILHNLFSRILAVLADRQAQQQRLGPC
jgi:hypothetical protein